MKQKEDTWGWMLAIDFFFAGMGGGMLLIAGVVELFVGGERMSLLGNFLAPLLVAAGALFLILELGRPFQAWRVFLNPKAILTVGAWCMLMAIGFGLVYASFGIESLPWSGWVAVRKVMAFLMALFGLVVATYPGILLGRHKSRPLWTGPGMVTLFLISSLGTGAAAHLLCGLILPPPQSEVINGLPYLIAGLLGFQLIFWLAYIWVKNTGTTNREAEAAQSFIRGEMAPGFWGGFLFAGTLLPLALMLISSSLARGIGGVLLLLGGLLMRILVVRGGQARTWLPGEERYRSRLPGGSEAFLKAWLKD